MTEIFYMINYDCIKDAINPKWLHDIIARETMRFNPPIEQNQMR